MILTLRKSHYIQTILPHAMSIKKSNRFIKDKEFWESNFENLPELTYISKNKK